jgi:histidinol-phosphate aminotransferase
VRMENATGVYESLKEKGIIVRNRSNVVLCDDCLRITVGTKEQNEELLNALRNIKG